MYFETHHRISGRPQEPDQGGDSPSVLDGDFVLLVGLAKGDIPQGTAGTLVDIRGGVTQ